MSTQRLSVTKEASEMIEELKEKHGELVFNQSGGCCDGSAVSYTYLTLPTSDLV